MCARPTSGRWRKPCITRQHNDANVLCLSGKYTDTATAIAMVDAFLTTAFEGGRHEARVCKASGSRIAADRSRRSTPRSPPRNTASATTSS